MEKTARTLVALAVAALLTTVVGAGVTGCSPLDESQKFNPADTASSATTVTGPSSL